MRIQSRLISMRLVLVLVYPLNKWFNPITINLTKFTINILGHNILDSSQAPKASIQMLHVKTHIIYGVACRIPVLNMAWSIKILNFTKPYPLSICLYWDNQTNQTNIGQDCTSNIVTLSVSQHIHHRWQKWQWQ